MLADTLWAATTLGRDGRLPNLTPPWRVQLAERAWNSVSLEKTRLPET